MKKSPAQYKELSYTPHPDSKIVNILSQFRHALSLFIILSLNLWRARCRHNIPSSLNIAECVSQTTFILLHLPHATLQEYPPPSTAQTPFKYPSQLRTFPLWSRVFSKNMHLQFLPNWNSSPVLPVFWIFDNLKGMDGPYIVYDDPPDASSVPDAGHAREAGRPQCTDVLACAVLPQCLWQEVPGSDPSHPGDVSLATWLCRCLFRIPTVSSALPFSNRSVCGGDSSEFMSIFGS